MAVSGSITSMLGKSNPCSVMARATPRMVSNFPRESPVFLKVSSSNPR